MRTDPNNQNIELGKVSWLRDYQQALQASEQTGKPVLLFFQEIPGCSTCVNYGRDVLSHPLMVEAIENEFIPLAIHNNKPGKDAEILALYNEPSWNNPVTHFVDAQGKDIVPKLANSYHPLALYQKIIEVIVSHKGTVPGYIQALGDDLKLQYGYAEKTVYETPCFWSGETSLAQHPGVIATMAGWIHGREVVEVFYDPQRTNATDLGTYAKGQGFFPITDHAAFTIDKNPQYYLKNSPFNRLPLSRAQRTRLNYAIPYQQSPAGWLSPKQLAWLDKGGAPGAHKESYAQDIAAAWSF